MKQFLASTAILALTAGFAAAEVNISGSARMGLIDDFGDVGVLMTSRVRVNFDMSGQTDTGLSFGASVRADQSGQGNTANNDSTVFVSGVFGKLSMGDVDGAATAAVGHVDGVGLTGLGDLNESMFIGNGGSNGRFQNFGFFTASPAREALEVTGDPSLLYEYSTGDLSVYLSTTQLSYDYFDTIEIWHGRAYAVGASYSMGDYKVSAGYEKFKQNNDFGDTGQADNIVLGADATFGAVTLKARIGQGSSGYNGTDLQENDQWALSATYAVDALSVTGFASNLQHSATIGGANIFEVEAIGLGASYDLGGGAKVQGGYVRRATTTGAAAQVTDSAADIGLSFSF